MSKMEKFLEDNGFVECFRKTREFRGKVCDKGNTRVYFEDTEIKVVRFNKTTNMIVEWKNTIDGNMEETEKEKLILCMLNA